MDEFEKKPETPQESAARRPEKKNDFDNRRKLMYILCGGYLIYLAIKMGRDYPQLAASGEWTGERIAALCGTIGFVGLIIPHVSRAIAGTAHRKLLPIAALSGGLFMLWVDAIARSLIPNTELPVGIFTALVGAPFFVYVMVRKKYGFGGN